MMDWSGAVPVVSIDHVTVLITVLVVCAMIALVAANDMTNLVPNAVCYSVGEGTFLVSGICRSCGE